MIMFRNRKLLNYAFNLLFEKYPTIEKAHYSLIGFLSEEDEKNAINLISNHFKEWNIKTKKD